MIVSCKTLGVVKQTRDCMMDQLAQLTRSLEQADIPYALIRDRAVDYYYSTVGEEPYFTKNQSDILIRRMDLMRLLPLLNVYPALKVNIRNQCVFVHKGDDYGSYCFRFLFAGERSHQDDVLPFPLLTQLSRSLQGWVIGLENLTSILLTRNYTEDRCHLFTMFEYGLIDSSWSDRLPVALHDRFEAVYTAYISEEDLERGLRHAS